MYEIVGSIQGSKLDPQSIRLPASWSLHYQADVPSTQDLARAAARDDVGSRQVFLTDFQSAGRGRSGRVWTAPPGSALLTTLLLREPSLAYYQHTMCVSVALCEALEHLTLVRPAIKWPNDLLIEGRKVCGILAESTDASPGYVAVGVGVNVSWGGARPVGVPDWATAIDQHAERPISRGQLLEETIDNLDRWLSITLTSEGSQRLREAWERRLWRRGESVVVQLHDRTVQGVLSGTDEHGALLLALNDGEQLSIVDGELLLPGRPPVRDR